MDTLNKHSVLGELSYAQVDFNWDTLEGAVNTLEFRVPPNNWSATTNPTTADNAGQGWRNGSKWYNRNTGQYFICVDATAGTWVEDVDIDISSLGTAAFEDVTTSPTDTAAGRLTKVGDFGLGEGSSDNIARVNDAVEFLNRGDMRRMLDSTSPFGGGANGRAYVLEMPPIFSRQALLALRSGNSPGLEPRAAIRIGSASAGYVSPWRELYSRGNILGTVSQSGGVPTGAVIESGSNANGQYMKLANGWMICTRNLGFQALTPPHTWTFPASFATVTGLVPLVTAGRDDAYIFNQYNVVPSVSSAVFHLSSASQFTWQFCAIGRWF